MNKSDELLKQGAATENELPKHKAVTAEQQTKSLNPPVTISVVVEWSKVKQKFFLVQKKFKNRPELKAMFPSKVIEDENDDSHLQEEHLKEFGDTFTPKVGNLLFESKIAAHEAIKKSVALPSRIKFITEFDFQDEHGNYKIYLYFGVQTKKRLTKIPGVLPLDLSYEEVLMDRRVTFLTKVCIQKIACSKKVKIKTLF